MTTAENIQPQGLRVRREIHDEIDGGQRNSEKDTHPTAQHGVRRADWNGKSVHSIHTW